MTPDEIKKQIVSAFSSFNPEKIILFGSLIRGDWDSESDVDMIIVYKTDKPFFKRLRELYMSWNIPRAVDILAYTPDEFDKMLNESHFIQDVVKESITIYERG